MKHVALAIVIVAMSCAHSQAQTDTTFSYQGELKDGGVLANGSYDLDFTLWNAAAADSPIGSTVSLIGVGVADGRFTVQLDFGANTFDNSDHWLAIKIDGVTLSPRKPITRAPYAIQTRGIFVNDDEEVGIGAGDCGDDSRPNGDQSGHAADTIGRPWVAGR